MDKTALNTFLPPQEDIEKILQLRKALEEINYEKINSIINELREVHPDKTNNNLDELIRRIQKTNDRIELLSIYALSLILTSSSSGLVEYFSPRYLEVFSQLSEAHIRGNELLAKFGVEQQKLGIEREKLKLQEKKLDYLTKKIESEALLAGLGTSGDKSTGSLNDQIERIMSSTKQALLEDPYAFSEEEEAKIDNDLKELEE